MPQASEPAFRPDGLTADQLSPVLDAVSYPVVVLDAGCQVLYVNDAGTRLFGCTRDQVAGREATEALPALFGEAFEAHRRSGGLLAAGRFEAYWEPLDLWTEVHCCPSPCGLLVCARDITGVKVRERILTAHATILEMVATGASLPEVLDAIAALIERQSAGDLCSILRLGGGDDDRRLYKAAGGSLPAEYNAAIDGLQIGPSVGSCGTAAFTGRPVIVSDIATDPRWAAYKEVALRHGLRACWSQPIVSRDGARVLGTVANYSRRPGEPGARALRLLQTAARLAQIAIEQDESDRRMAALLESEREARAAAESANRAKDRFIAALSHELRTPLTPVTTAAQMLEADPSLAADHRELVGMIRRNVELEARLIDDLLDATRISRGKLSLHLTTVDVHEQIGHVVGMLRGDADAKRLELTVSAAAPHHHVAGDPTRLQQVLWNLLKNAVKFTPAGGRITVRTENPAPGRLTVAVEDTGRGIDPGLLPHVFTPFEQGGPDVTRHFGGLGLGLAISRGLMELHGGRLAAHSDGPGRGATFVMELPTTKTTTTAAAASPARSPAGAARGAAAAGPGGAEETASRRLLLVEDHADTARIMARLLRTYGYEVVIAEGIGPALRAAGSQPFDVVISDLGLPDGSGLDLMRRLLAAHALKGIALSGYGMEEDIRKSAEAGFAAHLTKPVDLGKLRKVLTELTA